jgi:iron complex transport system substrate-binding protein
LKSFAQSFVLRNILLQNFSLLSFALLALFPALLMMTGVSSAREIVDATGTHVQVTDHPHRIITLVPSLGELTSDFLGLDLQRIVGVSESTDYPPALKKVASVGQYQRLSLEKILSLKPDLVLATKDGNFKDQIDHLREMGVPVVVLSTQSFSEIEDSMKQVALVLGESEESKRLIARFEQGLADLRARGARRTVKRKVLLQLDDDPLIVVGGKSFLNEAIGLVGAENVYGDSTTGYPRPSHEDVLKKNPDIVLVATFGETADAPIYEKRAQAWAHYSDLKAIQNNHVKVIYGDALLRPSMRMLEGLSLLEKAIYGNS